MLSLKRFKKILRWFFISLLLLIIGIWIFLQTPFGQNWVGRQVTKRLSRDLQTKVTIQHVSFSLLNKMHLEGVLIEDRDRDTLLYARDVKVRITDWFIFKKEAVLKYIGMEDAIVKFQRTDSVWRQQFIFDYFAPDTSSKKKKAGIRFDLKKVDLKNVFFVKKDAWLGEDMIVRVDSLDMDARELDFSERIFNIDQLYLGGPVLSISHYPRRKPGEGTNQVINSTTTIDSLLKWNSAEWVINVDKLGISNGVFKSDQATGTVQPGAFNGKHIEFNNINGQLTNMRLIRDTIYSNLDIKAKERSGFEVRKLQALFKMAPDGMAFTNLDLRTNRSTIRNSFAMSFDDFSDMADFIHNVTMTAQFEDSYIASDDIAFFAPAARKWNKNIHLNGRVRGTVDALVGKDMIVQAGSNTSLNGDISLTGLPNINETFIDFKANDFRTTYGDAVTFIPAVRKVTQLQKIRNLNFQGSFTGFIRDFVTFGTIQTNLGTVRTDINMKLPRGQAPVYSGNIATDNFRLGEFLGNKNLGAVSVTGVVKGRGFSDRDRNVTMDGKIKFLDIRDYRYRDITVKGTLVKKKFNGFAAINDPNAELTLNGEINFNNPTPSFDFLADVKRANLRNLKLTEKDLAFKGKFNLDFAGTDIDDFTGVARISDAELTKDGNRLPFDSLVVSSSHVGNIKTLTASSNEFAGTITGDFNINDLPDAFQLFLNKYYPSYIHPPRRFLENESFQFDITTQFVDDYIKLIDSSLSGFNYSHIYGNLDDRTNALNFFADVPQFRYKQYNFDNVKLEAHGNFSNLQIKGETNNIYINDSLNVPQVNFTINSRNDSSQVNIVTGANQTLDKANLNALVLTYNDGVKIEFDPSTFTINGKTWAIDESGQLEFRKSHPAAGMLVLREGDQKILLKTQPSVSGGRWNDLKVELVKVNVGDIAPFFLPKNRLEGIVSGDFLVEDPLHNPRVTSDNIYSEYLRLDNDSLGEARATLVYDNKTKNLKVKGSTVNQENFLGFDVDVYFDKALQKNNLIALSPRNFPVKILERFLGTLFSEMQGYLTGNVNISGEFTHLTVTGKGRLRDAGLKVNFTQVFYKILDTDIELTPTLINLDGLILTDSVTGNPIYVSGGIQHDSFKQMFYDLYISTRKPNTTGDLNNRPVLLLNTSYRNNKQFYGKAIGTGSLSLAGPQSDMFMKIDAIASTRDSSNITITSSQSRESGTADFLVERKYGREMSDSALAKNATRITYDVDVTANPKVGLRFVIDELTGDEIKGTGSGTLNIRSGTTAPLELRGRYDIKKGDYLFTFQSFFKKPFVLREGAGNFIEWDGDPYDARIHVDAVYEGKNISFAPITQQLSTDLARVRGDVNVVASLRDELFKPTIQFALEFPPGSPALTDPSLALFMQQLQRNTNEMNKQVTYLIVFNSFAPYGEVENAGTGLGINTISGIFLNVISDELNKILSNLFRDDKYRISVNTSIYNRNLIDPNKKTTINLGSTLNFSIGRAFFNDRFIITAGGGFDAPLQQSTVQQSIQLLPDVTMEWLLNESGTIRLVFFYRENADYLTTTSSGGPGKARRYGTSLTYRKDFDRLGDLFRRKKKLPPPPEQKPAAAAPEGEVPKQN